MARGALGLIGRFCPRSGESFFDIDCAEGLLEVLEGLAQERGSVAGVVHGASALYEENILLGALQALLGSRRGCAFKRSDKGLDVSEQPFGLLEPLGEGRLPIFIYSRELRAMAGHAAHVGS
jgi:hypothetical protein